MKGYTCPAIVGITIKACKVANNPTSKGGDQLGYLQRARPPMLRTCYAQGSHMHWKAIHVVYICYDYESVDNHYI